jgi:hypothetical protein
MQMAAYTLTTARVIVLRGVCVACSLRADASASPAVFGDSRSATSSSTPSGGATLDMVSCLLLCKWQGHLESLGLCVRHVILVGVLHGKRWSRQHVFCYGDLLLAY